MVRIIIKKSDNRTYNVDVEDFKIVFVVTVAEDELKRVVEAIQLEVNLRAARAGTTSGLTGVGNTLTSSCCCCCSSRTSRRRSTTGTICSSQHGLAYATVVRLRLIVSIHTKQRKRQTAGSDGERCRAL